MSRGGIVYGGPSRVGWSRVGAGVELGGMDVGLLGWVGCRQE